MSPILFPPRPRDSSGRQNIPSSSSSSSFSFPSSSSFSPSPSSSPSSSSSPPSTPCIHHPIGQQYTDYQDIATNFQVTENKRFLRPHLHILSSSLQQHTDMRGGHPQLQNGPQPTAPDPLLQTSLTLHVLKRGVRIVKRVVRFPDLTAGESAGPVSSLVMSLSTESYTYVISTSMGGRSVNNSVK